jgi:hypothetical protein
LRRPRGSTQHKPFEGAIVVKYLLFPTGARGNSQRVRQQRADINCFAEVAAGVFAQSLHPEGFLKSPSGAKTFVRWRLTTFANFVVNVGAVA